MSCFARLHPLHLPKQVGGDAGTRFVFGDGQASGVVHFVHWDTKSPDLRLFAVLAKTKARVHAYTQTHKVRRQQIVVVYSTIIQQIIVVVFVATG